MPRCFMAKKWKAYPWLDRAEDSVSEQSLSQPQLQQEQQEEPNMATVVTGHIEQFDIYTAATKRARAEQQHYQQQQQVVAMQTDDEEIDVVGDDETVRLTDDGNRSDNNSESIGTHAGSQRPHHTCWGPHSPTAGTTAPSPPPLNASGALYYNGYTHETWLNHEEPPKYATLRSAAELAQPIITSPIPPIHQDHIQEYHEQPGSLQQQQQHALPNNQSDSNIETIVPQPRKSLSMCFTSTGTALSLPPKKKDIYRPYSLQSNEIRTCAEEDLSAAQAILDLSASPAAPTHSIFIQTLPSTVTLPAQPSSSLDHHQQQQQQQQKQQKQQEQQKEQERASSRHHESQNHDAQNIRSPTTFTDSSAVNISSHNSNNSISINVPSSVESTNSSQKTIAYTYEAFFVSDGRSKRRSKSIAVPDKEPTTTQNERPKFTRTECGKQYATSSNLSRHKQTHRSLDSQSAKKCNHCGKAYVSMPALAMHVLTHKLDHTCGVCGKMFSRPWLLQGHLRSHTGEKPYGCAHCGKAFADRSNLRAHMQTHSADKNYECSRCHKTFALKSYLNKHLESACLKDGDTQSGEIKTSDDYQQQQSHEVQHNRGL